MFPAQKKGEWEPLKVRERKVISLGPTVEQGEKPNEESATKNANDAGDDAEPGSGDAEEEVLYEEDPTTEEGAVFPLQAGRVVNWSCFFALLTHVFNTLSPPFHTPILVVSQPAWTAKDRERLAQFFFEKFRTPAFCLMDSALAVSYAYATPTATVVDIGHSKCDITAVNDFIVSDLGRVIALAGCGGEGLTQRLFKLLRPRGFTLDMCEQLKRSPICEVLPPGVELPAEDGLEDRPINPATAASTAANGPAYGSRGPISASSLASQTSIVDEDQDRDGKEGEDNEGVLDVASIVVSGKTSEWVAKKEKEKAEKAAAKKAASDTAAPKVARLPNSKRAKATFHYNERRPLDDLDPKSQPLNTELEGGVGKRQKTPETEGKNTTEGEIVSPSTRKEEKQRHTETVAFVRKDIEVGIERFQAASGGILDQIVDSIHRCIVLVPEVVKRSELWDSIIIVGNGSKLKGQAGNQKSLIS
jgi:actin-related protein 9